MTVVAIIIIYIIVAFVPTAIVKLMGRTMCVESSVESSVELCC